jgi:hypothetical protein
MAQLFNRVIDGYNSAFTLYDADSLARNALLTLAAPDGPGRIESGYFVVQSVVLATVRDNVITLTVDGTVVFSDTIGIIFGLLDSLNMVTPWCSRHTGATYSQIQWLLNFDYESSASISIKNSTSPNPCNFWIGCNGRCGR